ncbi:FISUMP domain-containing protein [Fibrobacter sp. UWB10]|uniref:FISUMP domain-containing protein n=1 Tax=Fibrobacter sp. UWB10 TaxID=1896201 RepID=UPI002402FCAE|nr:FISUMP domain-containing protein [Fibrobacter sp. UWB10]SMP48542.1 major paralogous domain-containing protein [Fibrobacter sp. UWB10]
MKYFAALLISAVLFVACGDESSSSAPAPDPSEESSSSVEKTKESSSSVKPTSSDGKQSSSSTKKDESSSSVVKSSSSKNKSSSSVSNPASSSSFDINAPCTYGDIYIEEFPDYRNGYICYEDGWKLYVEKTILGMSCPEDGDFKRNQGVVYECVDGRWLKYEYSSSSSTPKSSSSQGYKSLPSPLHYNMSYGEFTDTRDGTKYATIDIDNEYGPDSVHLAFTVFAQNLKYHEKMVTGTEEQDDDTKVEMYCYNDSIEYCKDWWGGLYQWAEMMALPYECNSKNCADLIDTDGDGFHQGICPSGWHVMTERELLAASYASDVGVSEIERSNTIKSEISFSLVGGRNLTGMSLIATGYRLNRMDGNKLVVFKNLRNGTFFDFPAEYEAVDAATCRGGAVYSDDAYLAWGNQKRYGASVRCVKDY